MRLLFLSFQKTLTSFIPNKIYKKLSFLVCLIKFISMMTGKNSSILLHDFVCEEEVFTSQKVVFFTTFLRHVVVGVVLCARISRH